MTTQDTGKLQDLPADNAARLAIFDTLAAAHGETEAISSDELFDRVIGRLRLLVPRELHLMGDRAYVDGKVEVCIAAGIIAARFDAGQRLLSLTDRPPQVRYPDGEIRDYTAGLELARERLDRDNARLRHARFDVRMFVPSIADEPNRAPFQALLASMREHGFLKQFPIVRYQDDVVLDGRARLRAAATLHLDVEYLKYASDKDRTVARRRDTPLNRILVTVQSNAGRLSSDVLDNVYGRVADVTGRTWDETVADLELTTAWRRATPSEYSPVFEVKRIAYRPGDEAKIQVTSDDKVMLRSLIEAAGLSNYKIDMLRDHVPFERARSVHSAGRKAVFARIDDLITGIATMQTERRAAKLKLDPEWDQIRDWLAATFHPATS
jgi:hypothetical protein